MNDVLKEYAQLQTEHDALRAASKLMNKGLSGIIKEQARLLEYILKYSGFEAVLPNGWVEDCKRILAEDSPSDRGGK